MLTEAFTIRMECDTKGCCSMATVTEVSHEACNMRLYLIGWRLNGRTGKHLCPHCVERRNKRRKK